MQAQCRSIDQCPECQYPFTGLPHSGRCPECGFEYDERTQVWTPNRPWLIYLALLCSALGLIPLASRSVSQIARIGVGRPVHWLPLVFLVAVASLFLGSVYYLYTCNRMGRYVAIGPFGIRMRLRSVSRTIPWAEILCVKAGLFSTLIQLRNGKRIRVCEVLDRNNRVVFCAKARAAFAQDPRALGRKNLKG